MVTEAPLKELNISITIFRDALHVNHLGCPSVQASNTDIYGLYNVRYVLTVLKWFLCFSSFLNIMLDKGPFILHRNCVAVRIYRLLFTASHRNITAFQVKMNLTFMQYRNAVTSQFLCSRMWCGNATQIRRSMNRPLDYNTLCQVYPMLHLGMMIHSLDSRNCWILVMMIQFV